MKKSKVMSKLKEIGRFVVDSGECFIGDPHYKEAGIIFDGFGGDGGYAVYAEYNEYNEITSVRIDFTNSDKYPKQNKK